MGRLMSWLRERKTLASVAAITVLVGVPVTFAVLHQGFPVTDPDLSPRDVWVTNGQALSAGRINRPIEELDAAVGTASNDVDVMQHGDDVFLYDRNLATVQRVDPAYTDLAQGVNVPAGAQVAFGGKTLAILAPNGRLWLTSAVGQLAFDFTSAKPVAKLGPGAHVAVGLDGRAYATSPSKKQLLSFADVHAHAAISALPKLGEHQLSVVGETPVVLDTDAHVVIADGAERAVPKDALRIQQPGSQNDRVVVAASDSLLEVPLGGGDPTVVKTDAAPAAGAKDLAAPVWLDGCAHGAWSGSATYVYACDGAKPTVTPIEVPIAGAPIEFRVNKHIVVLNNLANGNVWLLDADMRLVDNWDEVTPPEETEELEGDEKSAKQSFEDTLAERTPNNRPPIARDDSYGSRPARTTVLDVLQNDTDPDGDVLTVTDTTDVAETAGRLDVIDGGRALQFTPAEGATGTIGFQYTVSDGRNGVATAQVSVSVTPPEVNNAPVAIREGRTSVEQGQSISYNVLTDWRDPDGDDIYLVNASPTSGDSVRFSPDGFVTFEHRSGELGSKEVAFTISDGSTSATGTLTVDVKAAGSLKPVGTPDFAQTFVGEPTVLKPLENDLSPSGASLSLVDTKEVPGGINVSVNTDRGTITVTSDKPGSFVFLYSVAAGASVSTGLVRVDVQERPKQAQPPIAVKDIAYLRPGQPTLVSVLANDVSPNGSVLALQSVDTSAVDDVLSVEMLTNTVVRISTTEALSSQLQLSYTASDGAQTSSATITVVPVPPLVKHQPPVALDDAATVRAGDIVTVPVLENDFHPDAAQMHLSATLPDSSNAGGIVFVAHDAVRYQAPMTAGSYSVVYEVVDEYGQTARATLRFQVTAASADGNRAPVPAPLTSRTFAGSTVKIDVPLDGLDPDGDSVVLSGVDALPQLGRIVATTSTSFTYEAYDGSAGTDQFSYTVQDTAGKAATGTVRIGVVPRPVNALPPNAVDDTIEMRPGRTASVDVLLNDSDPNGYAIKVASKLTSVSDGLVAKVSKNRRVIVTAPDEEGGYSLRYSITNGKGGFDTAFVQVLVKKDARINPPTAEDQVIEPKQVADGKKVTVDPLEDASNPGGVVDDLKVSVEGPHADDVDVASDGRIVVTPTNKRYTVAYRLTNTIDDLSAMAFVVVPAVPEKQASATADPKSQFPPPHLADLGQQIVRMNGSITWKAGDIVVVPSGKPALILSATATNSDGSNPFQDGSTITYKPAKDFRGPSTVTFTVTDGTSASDPEGRTATLAFPVTVGDPNFEDVPPTFTPPKITIEAGEAPVKIDLRTSSSHPNPDIVQKLAYSGFSGSTADVNATADGSVLTVSSPLGVQPGTKATISFTVDYKDFHVPGSVDVSVVSSTRPKAQALDDGPVEMKRGASQRIDVLANDVNPFAPSPALKVIDAQIDQQNVSGATVTHTTGDITVKAGPGFTGTLSVIYRVQDATKDPAREVQGRAEVVVRDVPDTPRAPTIVEVGDGSAKIRWSAPADNNAPITGYTVIQNGSRRIAYSPNDAGRDQQITGLNNGSSYTFTVVATNKMGDSNTSPASAPAVPYGLPGAPRNASLAASSDGSGGMTLDWAAPSDDGGRAVTRYEWRFTEGGGAGIHSTTATRDSANGSNGTTYRYEVRACNLAGCGAFAASSRATPTAPPPTVTLRKGTAMGPYHGAYGDCNGTCWFYDVTVAHFSGGSVTVTPYCNGGALKGRYTITLNSSGGGRYQGRYNNGIPESFCGDQAYVSVDGVRSNDW
ncbi:Ig-like domain-containing protein [Rathayibacter sp. YIM 133350]|uniref:Ig-like domain-containing protein n=1 Tax=Rathayibacter sp. YIM 133350 TaxID=3131992 RepID=UPI00307F1A01